MVQYLDVRGPSHRLSLDDVFVQQCDDLVDAADNEGAALLVGLGFVLDGLPLTLHGQ